MPKKVNSKTVVLDQKLMCQYLKHCLFNALKKVFWVSLALATLVSAEYGLYHLGKNSGFNEGAIQVLEDKEHCNVNDVGTRYLHEQYSNHHFECNYSEDDTVFKWQVWSNDE